MVHALSSKGFRMMARKSRSSGRTVAAAVIAVLPALARAETTGMAAPRAMLSAPAQTQTQTQTQSAAGVSDISPIPTPVGFQIASLRQVPSQMSRECSVRGSTINGRAPLRFVRRVLRENRPIKVLAIGSSSIVGVGASSAIAGYTVRLEHDLEGFLKGFDIDLIPSGMSGEQAESTASRIRAEVEEKRPDLIVWQVGTNDAMAHVGEERITNCLRTTLDWLATQKVDVVLINPQYVDRLAADDYYRRVVEIIADVARERRVLVVDRYQAMAELAWKNGNNTYLASDKFHLNDLGYRCMAEHSARAIVSGILQADAESATAPAQTPILVPPTGQQAVVR